MIKAKIVGAGGYGGVGMTELLLQHPHVEIGCLVSLSDTGRAMSDVFGHLKGLCDEVIVSPEDPKAQEAYDVVIFSTPDGVGMQQVEAELAKGAKVIDYSGDFRFNTAERYSAYAEFIGRDPQHASAHLLAQTQYGLPELHTLSSDQSLIGNPGCFAISAILALAPAVQAGLIDLSTIICDGKTGVSGAGKKLNAAFHFPNRYDNMNAYRLSGHQHLVEIEQELGLLCNEEIKLTFTAQVVPLCRGIMSTCYAQLHTVDPKAVLEAYEHFYADHAFVRVSDVPSSTADVRGTNYCNLSVDVDERTGRLRVISHIDNLMKGQAGNAVQVLNHLFGWAPSTALERPGQYP